LSQFVLPDFFVTTSSSSSSSVVEELELDELSEELTASSLNLEFVIEKPFAFLEAIFKASVLLNEPPPVEYVS
jgi:hypothetical protein